MRSIWVGILFYVKSAGKREWSCKVVLKFAVSGTSYSVFLLLLHSSSLWNCRKWLLRVETTVKRQILRPSCFWGFAANKPTGGTSAIRNQITPPLIYRNRSGPKKVVCVAVAAPSIASSSSSNVLSPVCIQISVRWFFRGDVSHSGGRVQRRINSVRVKMTSGHCGYL